MIMLYDNITKMKKNMQQYPYGVERRQFIRHPLCFPIMYKILEKPAAKGKKTVAKKTGGEKPSTTVNISRGGLMFAAKLGVDVDAKIVVKMPVLDKVFNVRARVVHCNKNADTDLYNVGVCFYRMSDAFKIKLIEQMYLIIEYRDLHSIELGRELTLQEASREWIKRFSKRFERLYW